MDYAKFRKDIRSRFEELATFESVEKMAFEGKNLAIFPQVFSPKLFSESMWFAEQLEEIVSCKSMLEIGTGTGVISLYCALQGATEEATDINAQAVENAKYNFKQFDVEIPVYSGDVFEEVPNGKKYDVLFWNHPFNRSEKKESDDLLKSIFDYKYESLEKYVANAHLHLSENGRLLLGSGNLADFDYIQRIGQKHGYEVSELTRDRCYIDSDDFELYCVIYEFEKIWRNVIEV